MRVVSSKHLPIPKVALVGEGGSGKTTVLASVYDDPRTTPPLWIDIRGNPHKVGDKLGHWFCAETPEDVVTAVDYLAAGQPNDHPFYKTFKDVIPEGGYKSFVLDTASDLQKEIIQKHMDDTYSSKNQLETMLAYPELRPLKALEDGNLIATISRYIFLKVAKLPVPVFTSFHINEALKVEQKGGHQFWTTELRADLWGSIRRQYSSWWNLVGIVSQHEEFVGRKKERFVKVVWGDPNNKGTKDQLFRGVNVPSMNNPTITKIMDLLEESVKDRK